MVVLTRYAARLSRQSSAEDSSPDESDVRSPNFARLASILPPPVQYIALRWVSPVSRMASDTINHGLEGVSRSQ